MKIVDTHTHLYLPEFENDISEVMNNALKEGIEKFYLPSIDSTEHERLFTIEKKFAGKCFAMMGLHPCSVKENYQEELALVNDWLQKRKFAAIGEIGLDFYWDKTFIDQQYESFHQQIEWALHFNLPVVIHTRNAMQETIDVVKKYTEKGLHGIFHCFSGDYQNALDIIDAGFLLGIGGVITYKNARVAEAIKEIDLAHIVLETDSPYLTPAPFRGKRNESSYIKYVLQKLTEIKNISIEEVAGITTTNAEKIFAT
ncbi:MAG: TatD family hydrolase [Chitinophagaceae bacterium]|nr:TatD family hydrolase [Chitinophagaceae bacterium]